MSPPTIFIACNPVEFIDLAGTIITRVWTISVAARQSAPSAALCPVLQSSTAQPRERRHARGAVHLLARSALSNEFMIVPGTGDAPQSQAPIGVINSPSLIKLSECVQAV